MNYIGINNVDPAACYSLWSHSEHQKRGTALRTYGARPAKSISGVLFTYGRRPIIYLAATNEDIIIILYASCHSNQASDAM